MKLVNLTSVCTPVKIVGDTNADVTGIEIDSRQIKEGNVFIAMRGSQVDGHDYIDKAVCQGATVVVCEEVPANIQENVTYLQYPSTEEVAGKLATTFYGNPTKRMKLIGVTGTNGKTTIATVLFNIFRRMGHKCGLCSTVCNYIDSEPIPTECTTPDPITLNKLLGRMADEGCEYAFMEVSSHSVAQKRIAGLTFAGGIFTNLTRDHLDYHKTFDKYRDAKKAFFDSLPKDAFAIVNADDKNGMVMVQNCKATTKTYSVQSAADFKCRIMEESFEGMVLEMDGREVCVQFVGRFNASNLLAS